MTERFLKVMPEIFHHEGGFNDIKKDSGGATNFGISLLFLKSINHDIDGDGDVDWLDIKALTKEQALELYYDNFWKPLYEKLSERLSFKVFDTAVNAGNGRSHILLQKSLNLLGSNVSTDGVIGSQTLAEISKYHEEDILKSYTVIQSNFYKSIVDSKPDQAKFLKGWLNRASWLPK